jgi:GH18 family chitinase
MKKLILIFLVLFAVSFAQSADTLQYRVAYYPVWCYADLPPWDIDFGGITHVNLFNEAFLSTTSPYWTPAFVANDSIDIEKRGISINGLDSLKTKLHREGRYVLVSLHCVDATELTYICADSTRTQVFHNTLKAWMVRKGMDGWDLNVETNWGGTTATMGRFIRIGRRVGYDAAFPNGRALIGIAMTRGTENWYPISEIDSMVTYYDVQMYSYQWMWNGSANATWFQTPTHSPASCGNCENSSMDKDFVYSQKPIIDSLVGYGLSRSKILAGYATSCVTGFTGTNQLSVAWSGSSSDLRLTDVEDMVNHGGTWTHDATAHASYIAGTATTGNSLGFGNGTQFFLPFEDSTDIKAGIDYLKTKGYGGIMFYDYFGDMRVGATPAWKRTPYIYASSMYAASLASGQAPTPTISVGTITGFGNQTVNTTSSEKTYSVSGSDLTGYPGNITVTAPTGFEVSLSTGTGFASSVNVAYSSATLVSTTIYVVFKPTLAQAYSGNITNAGGGATTQNVAVSGTGTAAEASGTKYFGRK